MGGRLSGPHETDERTIVRTSLVHADDCPDRAAGGQAPCSSAIDLSVGIELRVHICVNINIAKGANGGL